MAAAAQVQPKRVLVIDDDPAVLKLLSAALKSKSFETVACETGTAGLSALQAQACAVVLLDLQLPDVHGLELIRSLRQVAPAARFVIITADTTSESLIQAIREQAFDYVRKP